MAIKTLFKETIMPQTADAALYFQAHYILWVVGRLEDEICDELDSMTAPGEENWKQVMRRICPWSSPYLQHRFRNLCKTMSEEEALDELLQEVGFSKSLSDSVEA